MSQRSTNCNATTVWQFEQIAGHLRSALKQLLSEPKLFEFKVNERTLTQRLSLHLQPLFQCLSVDCEYNRQWTDDKDLVKRLQWRAEKTKTDDVDGATVYPDIIVHLRGLPTTNILVVEAKRDAQDLKPADKDYLKLKAFTDPKGTFKYIIGAHINFLTKTTHPPIAHVVWFEGGHPYHVEEDISTAN